jgi:threonine dehydrogenase-like Zn-dependent dehydrogenase
VGDRAVDPVPARLEHARRFGAEVTLDAGALDRGERLAALREATGGLGPDLVVSCSGTPETFSEAVEAVRPGGTVIEAGAFCAAGAVQLDPNLVCAKGIAVLGVGGEVLQQYAPALRMLTRHRDRLPFGRMITHRIALEQVAAMLDEGPSGGAVKVLVAPNGHPDR